MRRWFRDLSIRWKLTLVITAAVQVFLVATFLAILAFDWRNTHDSVTREVTALADVVGSASAAALAFHDVEAARQTLESVRVRPSIASVQLIDAAGDVLATYRHDEYRGEFPMVPASERVETGNGRLVVSRKVSYRGQDLGMVAVEASLGEARVRMLAFGALSAALFLVAAAAGFILATRLQRVISTPILALASAAQAVAQEKNYEVRAKKKGDDEIGGLTDAFNEMLEEIHTRDEALRTSREELRGRVGELQVEVAARERAQEALRLREEEYRHLAFHDPLTSLANRALFHDHVELALARAARAHERMAVLFLDVDRFKLVNDTMGHNVGDQLLIALASRLKECLRNEDTLARVGGDEFVILLPHIETAADAAVLARRILTSLQEPLPAAGTELSVSASIGISLYPDDAKDLTGLMRNADAAMYRAKETARGSYQLFEAELHARTLQRVRLERELRTAISRGELRLFYQPVLDTETRQIVAAEALARWDHPDRGMVLPDEFIPLAEETGLILAIGAFTLETACREAVSWTAQGLPPARVLVNVSARQFGHADLVSSVAAVLAETGLEPARLELELTESVAIGDVEAAIGKMNELRALGVRLSIDDFGTGYSSLTYLRQFPLDTLKLDRSFVKGIEEGGWNGSIAQAIVSLGHGLGVHVVAEGVETEGQAVAVKFLKCDQVQGFLFFRPQSSMELRTTMRANARRTGPMRIKPKPAPVDPLRTIRAEIASSGPEKRAEEP